MKPLSRAEIEMLGRVATAALPRLRAASHLIRTDGPGDAISAKAGRQLNLGAAILALAVLADSGLEHYRGSFRNKAMFAPLAVSTLTLGASLFGAMDTRPRRHPVRDGVYALAAATAAVGFGFHAYNITKRPGRLSWLNLFYGAPIGAPVALALAGLLGRGAERAREQPAKTATIFGRPAGRLLGGLASAGILGTSGEAALLHFRGAFQNPFMLARVSVPPLAAALVGAAAVKPDPKLNAAAKAALWLTAAVGLLGPCFHAFGVHRGMGGWRNWSQNLLNGPPLPAPPAFTGLALAGLAALDLIEAQDHD